VQRLRVHKYLLVLAHAGGRVKRLEGRRLFEVHAPSVAHHAGDIGAECHVAGAFGSFDFEPEDRAACVHQSAKRERAFCGVQNAAHLGVPHVQVRFYARKLSSRLQRDLADAEALPDVALLLEVAGVNRRRCG
jgi:hypothetical protein